ncbi:hypothetical protein C8R44DRAFT_982184 [Mycena epipterygia]|nr:hypothetical protein C8R44DRAFT_982184 [Mycena epipterygia]
MRTSGDVNSQHRRHVVNQYPFIQFCTVIALPHFIWFNIEIGLQILSTRESFSATYGQIRRQPFVPELSSLSDLSQLLAIFVTIPPFLQLCLLLPRVLLWFVDLTWVRIITRRQDKPFLSKRPNAESALPMQDAHTMVMQKFGPEGLPTTETLRLHDYSRINGQANGQPSSGPRPRTRTPNLVVLFRSHSSSRIMDAFTYTTSKVEETVLPPVNEDSGSGSSGSCVVCKEDSDLPLVNEDSSSGSSGSCIIA